MRKFWLAWLAQTLLLTLPVAVVGEWSNSPTATCIVAGCMFVLSGLGGWFILGPLLSG